MADLNKVFLIGRLTHDPEPPRFTPSGAAVATLRLATGRTYTTKDGDRREETLFIDITVWNRQAENCCQYLKKGSQIHVDGYLKMDTWQDKTTGENRSKVKVEAERVQFLDSRRDGSNTSPDSAGEDDFSPPPGPSGRRSAPAEPRGGFSNGSGGGGGGSSRPAAPQAAPRRPAPAAEPEDDDIPF